MRQLRDNKGFTLIELMIVVVIIGILAAIAIPKFTSLGDDAKTKEADTAMKQIATLQDAFRAKCGVYVASLTEAANDCNDLTDVGYQAPTLQYYQAPTVALVGTTGFTVTAAPSATTGQGLATRVYSSATGAITDAAAAAP